MNKDTTMLRAESGVNYVRHLNAAMEVFSENDQLNPSHISLYLALFQLWNLNLFRNPFSVSREETMKLSKLGSRTTYLKCLHELTQYGYIDYQPSHHPLKGSLVTLFSFSTSPEQVVGPPDTKIYTSTGQALGPSINNKKLIKEETKERYHAPIFDQVLDFFNGEDVPSAELEARRFYNHYSALNWKIGGRHPVENWKPLAENWFLRTLPHVPSSAPAELVSDFAEPL